MMVLKYSCPKCNFSMECEESKSLDEDVCSNCGNVFIPGSCPDIELVETKSAMPPLPRQDAPPPARRKTNTALVRKKQASIDIPPPKRIVLTKDDIVTVNSSMPIREFQRGSYSGVILATLLLFIPPSLYILNNYEPRQYKEVFTIVIISWPLTALLTSYIAYSKGLRFWYWWMASWFLPGINLVTLIGAIAAEPLVICSNCGMRIPRQSHICRYCGK